MTRWKKKSCGFTLIELLISIVVIGILAGAGIASYTNALTKGRDARRKQEIIHLQVALQSYFADKGVYPVGPFNGYTNACSHLSSVWSDPTTGLANKLIPAYIKQLPLDPLNTYAGDSANGANYVYCYNPASDGTVYTITDNLENKSDPAVTNPSAFWTYTAFSPK